MNKNLKDRYTMDNPRISIIVPCYNGEKYLRETLDCLQKQTIQDWECIIVNDGSTDGSLEIMKEYAKKDSRYKYIDKVNEGPSIARNTGIAASSGIYILPLDADDIIEPDYAEIGCNYLDNHKKTKVVYSFAEYFGDRTGIWDIPDYSYESELWANAIFCTAIYRREDFNRTLGYNPNMKYGNEDYDFWLSFLKEDDDVYKIPKTMLRYRQHGVSRTTILHENEKESLSQLVINHLDRYQPHLWKLLAYEFENRRLKMELDNMVGSTAYKIGRLFVFPYWSIKIFFKKMCNF